MNDEIDALPRDSRENRVVTPLHIASTTAVERLPKLLKQGPSAFEALVAELKADLLLNVAEKGQWEVAPQETMTLIQVNHRLVLNVDLCLGSSSKDTLFDAIDKNNDRPNDPGSWCDTCGEFFVTSSKLETKALLLAP